MSTVPAEPAGLVTVIEVALVTVIPPVVFAWPPNFTLFAPVRFVPVIVTTVPPNVEPVGGAMPVTVGSKTVVPPLEDPVEFFHCAIS